MLSDIEFELFYAELDAQSSNVSIGHSEKAQEYIYVIHGKLLVHTERGGLYAGSRRLPGV